MSAVVSDLFELTRGTCVSMADKAEGPHPLVSATTYKNGVCSFIAAEPAELFPAGCITVAVIGEGSVMYASVQAAPFAATINVEVLVPKSGHPFFAADREARLVALATQLRKARWRFHYGRIASGRVKSLRLDLGLAQRTAAALVGAQTTATTPTLEVGAVLQKLKRWYGDAPTIGDVFEIQAGSATAVADLTETGAIPVISATEKETNGVAGFLAAAAADLKPARTITVAKDGKPGVARVQLSPYHATEHVSSLVPRDPARWSVDELCVLAALIENQTWRFNFGRAASFSRLAPLPLY